MTEPEANRYAAALFLLALATSGAFYFAPSLAWWVSGGMSVGGLILVGIPHGALDVFTHGVRNNPSAPLVYIGKYLAAIGLVLMGWLFMPTLTLIGFLLLSAWHFGQADFELWKVETGGMIWGLFVLGMILGWHLDEVQSILLPIGVSEIVLSGVEGASNWIEIATIVGWVLALAFAIYLRKTPWIWSLLMLATAPFIPVLMAFMIFFVGQHSMAGWSHLKNGLKMSSLQLWIRAAPFQLGAWAIIIGGVYLFGSNDTHSFHATVGWFFAFLGSISIPHIIESHRFIQQIKDRS
jgi:Brp/Blh family beta-carotene 15,15'-monooxygenase